jgi:gluconokinase
MVQTLNVGGDRLEIENQLAEIRPDQHGLTVLPFWSGERSTGWHEDARGAVLGLRSHTRPIEIVRASMEAVAYRFGLIADALGSFATPTKIVASGGALNASKVWTQILADVMGRPVVLSDVNEASSRGAAIFALRSIGVLSYLKGADIDGDPQFNPDDEAHKIYKKALARQEEFYGQLIENRDR